MKKLIVILLAVLIITVALAACTPGNKGDGNESTNKTTEAPSTANPGMITDTGTDTNIIDKIESDIIGTGTSAMK